MSDTPLLEQLAKLVGDYDRMDRRRQRAVNANEVVEHVREILDTAVPEFPLRTAQAFELARWYTSYAIDHAPADDRIFHPGVTSHGSAALTQLAAVLEALKCDQVDPTGVRAQRFDVDVPQRETEPATA